MPSWKKLVTSGSSPHFTHITASGNISSSGDIKANSLGVPTDGKVYLDVEQSSPNDYLAFQSGQIEIFKGGTQRFSIQANKIALLHNTAVTGHISSSGNITASGNFSTTTGNYTGVSASLDYITTTGNISSSATSTGSFGFGIIRNKLGVGTVAPDYDLDVAGTVGVANYIYHNGDENTYILFEDDKINLVAGGKSAYKFDHGTGKIQINNGNNDLDLQVMGKGGDVILHTDAILHNVGIGTTNPANLGTGSLTVAGAMSSSGAISTLSHITASGNISASGDLYANSITLAGGTGISYTDEIEGPSLTLDSAGQVIIDSAGSVIDFSRNGTLILRLDPGSNSSKFTGNITASGNISASGNVLAAGVRLPGAGIISFDDSMDGTDQSISGTDNNITIDGDEFVRILADDHVQFRHSNGTVYAAIDPNAGHITASGNISSSGIITGEGLVISDDATISDTMSADYMVSNYQLTVNEAGHGGGDFRVESATNQYMLFSDANQEAISIGANASAGGSVLGVTGDITATTHITASGNISSSGDITAGTFTAVGNINANGNIIGDDATDITNIESIFCDNIVHDGDTDTNIGFGTDNITLTAGDANMIYAVEGAGGTQADKVAINNALTDVDFQVKSSGSAGLANLIRTDAANERVAIGFGTLGGNGDMSSSLHIGGDLTVGKSGSSGGHITASGHISASGNLYGNTIYVNDKYFVRESSGVATIGVGGGGITNVMIYPPFTASGDISSSGTITATTFVGNIDAVNGDFDGLLEADEITINGAEIGSLFSPIEGSAAILTLGAIEVGEWTSTTPVASAFLDADTAHLTTDQTFTGKKTFSTAIIATGISSSADISSSANIIGNILYNTASITAIGNVQGDVVKFGGSTTVAGAIYAHTGSGWSLAHSGSAGGASSSLALAAGTNSTTHGMLLRGMANIGYDPGGLNGCALYLETPGSASSTLPASSGHVSRVIAYNYGGDTIYFNPDNTWVLLS